MRKKADIVSGSYSVLSFFFALMYKLHNRLSCSAGGISVIFRFSQHSLRNLWNTFMSYIFFHSVCLLLASNKIVTFYICERGRTGHMIHHEPERTGSLKIRKVWLLGSDVMGLQVSRRRIWLAVSHPQGFYRALKVLKRLDFINILTRAVIFDYSIFHSFPSANGCFR